MKTDIVPNFRQAIRRNLDRVSISEILLSSARNLLEKKFPAIDPADAQIFETDEHSVSLTLFNTKALNNE